MANLAEYRQRSPNYSAPFMYRDISFPLSQFLRLQEMMMANLINSIDGQRAFSARNISLKEIFDEFYNRVNKTHKVNWIIKFLFLEQTFS